MKVVLAIFLMGNVCLIAALLGALCLVRQSRVTRTDLPFTIQRMQVISGAIFNVLGSSVGFHPFLRRIAYRTGDSIMDVFIFIGFILPCPSSDSKVKSTVSTSSVGTDAYGTIKDSFSVYRFLSRREFFSDNSCFDHFDFKESLLNSYAFDYYVFDLYVPNEDSQ